MQDPVTKAEHYRKAANKYGEMAKQEDVDYVWGAARIIETPG